MKNYYFKMLRTYETFIQVEAETPEEAIKEFEKLGETIYDIELEQTCITDESLTIREGWEGVETPINENPFFKFDKADEIVSLLKKLDVDGETMEYILKKVGMEDQMANQLVNNKTTNNE